MVFSFVFVHPPSHLFTCVSVSRRHFQCISPLLWISSHSSLHDIHSIQSLSDTTWSKSLKFIFLSFVFWLQYDAKRFPVYLCGNNSIIRISNEKENGKKQKTNFICSFNCQSEILILKFSTLFEYILFKLIYTYTLCSQCTHVFKWRMKRCFFLHLLFVFYLTDFRLALFFGSLTLA